MRDARLDFWRGLCLIDMVLVHLVHEGVQFGALAPWITEYTRFAAGGFVFVAGLGVGLRLLHPVRGAPPAPRDAAAVLWRRALYLLGMHYALTGVIVALAVLRGLRPPPAAPLALVVDVALLREAPPYGDVLPLYVVMLVATPATFVALRRGLWPLVMAASVGLFAWGRYDPTALSPVASREFPFLLWQAFFVGGLLWSGVVRSIDRTPRAWWPTAAAAWAAFLGIGLLAFGPRFGVLPESGFVRFGKVPLTTGELLRYLACTITMLATSAVAWPRLRTSWAAAAVAAFGRRSLAVYVAHVFVQMLVVAAVAPLWWIGSAQIVLAAAALASLWALARALDRWERTPWTRPYLRRAVRGWGAPPAGMVAAALLIVLVRPPSAIDQGGLGEPSPADVVADVDLELHGPGLDLVGGLEAFPGETAAEGGSALHPEDTVPALDDAADQPLQSGLGAARSA